MRPSLQFTTTILKTLIVVKTLSGTQCMNLYGEFLFALHTTTDRNKSQINLKQVLDSKISSAWIFFYQNIESLTTSDSILDTYINLDFFLKIWIQNLFMQKLDIFPLRRFPSNKYQMQIYKKQLYCVQWKNSTNGTNY